MPRQRVVRIYVQPYVRKWLLARLGDPVRLALDMGAQDLLAQLNEDMVASKRLARRITGVIGDLREGEKNRAYIDLWMCATHGRKTGLSRWQHGELAAILTRHYFTQLFRVVEWCRANKDTGKNQRAAILLWLESMGIAEEEHALHSIERVVRKRKAPDAVDPFLPGRAGQAKIRRDQKPMQLVLFREL